MDYSKPLFAAGIIGVPLLVGALFLFSGSQDAETGATAVAPPGEASAAPADIAHTFLATPMSAVHEWYIADQDFKSCIKTGSPADQIESLRQGGGAVSTNENRTKIGDLISVEVATAIGDGLQERYWTYYTSKEGCESALEAKTHNSRRL